MVSIGPKSFAKWIHPTELTQAQRRLNIEPGSIHRFTVEFAGPLDDKNTRYEVRLRLADDPTVAEKIKWEQLPESLESVTFHLKTVRSCMSQYPELERAICPDRMVGDAELKSFLAPIYERAYANGDIFITKASPENMRFHFHMGLKDAKGVPMSACFKRAGEKWFFTTLGYMNASGIMESLVDMGDWSEALNRLSDMALGNEDWDYGNSSGEKRILKQYLRFSFYKSWLDGLVLDRDGNSVFDTKTGLLVKDGLDLGDVIFNTGLVNGSFVPIYCYLRRHMPGEEFHPRRWEFGFMACRGQDQGGKRLNEWFREFPKAPQYIDPENLSNLFYNTDRSLSCDYQHIIRDRLQRLPIGFIRNANSDDEEMVRLTREYEETKDPRTFEKIRALITDDGIRGQNLFRNIQKGIEDAVETAIAYCKWNYKTAIPIYYPQNNAISLLLPLFFGTDAEADVALVVELLPSGNYQGQTILTMAMAYQDARQICRPNSEWLTASRITDAEDTEDYEDEID